ncbi:recombinase family protein [Mesorhizobium sp. M0491]|uniref:recombinase family protein n=1 Tax=Mesorhizobium sp. M0491 TaxID=2956950 RepID=UPI00333943AF
MKIIHNSNPKLSESIEATDKVLKSSVVKESLIISYIRWSTVIQGEGDSYRRQKCLADEWCKKQGLELAPEHIMTDAGLSAYKGKNVSEGALGAFLKAVQEGRFPAGTILLVENLDRLSRQHPMVAMNLLHQIVEAGIVVVTLGDRSVEYRKPLTMGDMFNAIIDLSNAHVESEKKQFRSTRNWEKIHADLEQGKPMGNCPAWLRVSKDRQRYEVEIGRATVVERMFDMCISGLGLPAIAKALNDAGVKPWAMEKRKTRRADYWTIASVSYFLASRAVFGEFYSPKLQRVYPNHFPVIVEREIFDRAQAAKATRLKAGRGRKGATYTNLFGQRAYCQDCEEPMTIRNPKKGRATQFYCKGTLHGQCNHRPWNYNVFEESFLTLVNELDMQAIIHGGSASRYTEIIGQMQALEGQKIDLESKVNKLAEMMLDDTMPVDLLKPKMQHHKKLLDETKERVAKLDDERNAIQLERSAAQESNRITFPTDISTIDLYNLRAKAAQHIKTLVDHIELKRMDIGELVHSFYTVRFVGGGKRTVFVNYSNPRKPFAVSGNPDASDYVHNKDGSKIGIRLGGNVKGMEFT